MKVNKHLIFRTLISTLFLPVSAFCQNFYEDRRSDSLEIVHYNLVIDVSDEVNRKLNGKATLDLLPHVSGLNQAQFDLKGLQVDSVKYLNQNLSFSVANDKLTILFPSALSLNTPLSLAIFYQGTPTQDPVFGGFYFQPNSIFNVGVSFSEVPHNYGRVWYPCYDNFISRSTYSITVVSKDTKKAICGGLLTNETFLPNQTVSRTWQINQSIPSYLVAIAVSNFVEITGNVYSQLQQTDIPFMIAALPADTARVQGSFVHLEEALQIYEQLFGPYHWDRIGYALVPLTGGAMEHAMNIAYPPALVGGSTANEDVLVHELSHHWWGNLVTCKTAEDMWINEGIASYCEYLFAEQKYGRNSYDLALRNLHKNLVHKAHIEDGGYWPLSGMPQNVTYGTTTYQKGADIMHTLRNYVGDSLFFTGLKQVIEDYKFKPMSADDFQISLSGHTGMDLSFFFNDWIKTGGWPHFSVDSVVSTPNGNNSNVITVHYKQKFVGRNQYAQNVPIQISFKAVDGSYTHQNMFITQPTGVWSTTLPYIPEFTFVNRNEAISHAATADEGFIKTANIITPLPTSYFRYLVPQLTDSIFYRVEHNFVAPDFELDWSQGHLLNPQRYWSITIKANPNDVIKGRFDYNGRTSGNNGYLDNMLITGNEDSLVLMYRPGPGYIWEPYPQQVLVAGNTTDKMGYIETTGLPTGQYCFALKSGAVQIEQVSNQKVQVYPNPSQDYWTIQSETPVNAYKVYNLKGQLIQSGENLDATSLNLQNSSWQTGVYIVHLTGIQFTYQLKLIKS